MNRFDQQRHGPSTEYDLFGWQTIFHWVGFLLRAPRRHKLLAACAFLLVFGLACVATIVLPSRYQVQATLLAGYPQASALSSRTDQVPDATHAAREVMLRRENLRDIIRRTNFVEQYLERRPWASRAKDELLTVFRSRPRTLEDLEEGLLDTLEERLWVDVHGGATIIITFQWWDPELARQIVDAAQESFIRTRRVSEVEAVGQAIEILEGQQLRLNQDIESAIDAFEKKQEQLRIATPARTRQPTRGPAPDREHLRLEAELATKRRSLSEMEAARRQRVTQLQADLLRQESVYAANHPAILSTRRELSSLVSPSVRATEVQTEIEELERQLAHKAGKEGSRVVTSEPYLEARLRLDMEDPRLDFERGQLENLLRQHAELRNRIENLKVEQELADAAFEHRYSIISPAQIPRGPIRPLPLIFLVGGLIGGIAFAFFAAAAADIRSGLLIERWQVEHHLALPILLEIPKNLPNKG